MTENTILSKELDCPPGIYEHFKGRLYRVYGTALNRDTGKRIVLYTKLYDIGDPELEYRTVEEFTEAVGTVTRIPRFRLIQQESTQFVTIHLSL